MKTFQELVRWVSLDYGHRGYFILPDRTPPELLALKGIQQSRINHPEGDAYEHTLCVIEAAAEICQRENLEFTDRFIVMVAALCHDFGKAVTTVWNENKQRWTSYGHDKKGAKIAYDFLKRLDIHEAIADQICTIVSEHMCHHNVVPNQRVVNRFLNRIAPAKTNPMHWVYVCEADHSGRPPIPKKNPVKDWIQYF